MTRKQDQYTRAGLPRRHTLRHVPSDQERALRDLDAREDLARALADAGRLVDGTAAKPLRA